MRAGLGVALVIHWELYNAPTSSLLGAKQSPGAETHVPQSWGCWAGEAMGTMGAGEAPT